MIVTPRVPSHYDTEEAFRILRRMRAKVHTEYYAVRIADVYFRWPTWIMAGIFIFTLMITVICARSAPHVATAAQAIMYLDAALLELGGLIAISDVYVQFIRSLMPSDEVRQRLSAAYDAARARLVGSEWNYAERRKYVYRIAWLPSPVIAFFSVNKGVNVAQLYHELFAVGNLGTFIAVLAVTASFAGAIALYAIWRERIYVLTAAIGDDGGALQIFFGLK